MKYLLLSLTILCLLTACKEDDELELPPVDPCTVLETGLVLQTGQVFLDSIFPTNIFYMREENSDAYTRKVLFSINNNYDTENIRWQIGTDPRDFAGQTEVYLEFKVTGTIPVRVIAPRPIADPDACRTPPPLDTVYTEIEIAHHPEPFLEIVGTYRGDSPLHPGEEIEFEITYGAVDNEGILFIHQIKDFPEFACPQFYRTDDGELVSVPDVLSVTDHRFAYLWRGSPNSQCGAINAYFIFSDDQERVRVEFRHRYTDESEFTHYTFHGERVE